jgi:hypothetical protein
MIQGQPRNLETTKKHVFTNKLCFDYNTKFDIKLIIHATSKQDVNKPIY